jgi:putative FmdB family regulatory protein
MPLYSYYCPTCDKTYERLVSMSASQEVDCERCGGLAKRTLGNIVTKGSVKSSGVDKSVPNIANVFSI